jgi:hypothetical protein
MRNALWIKIVFRISVFETPWNSKCESEIVLNYNSADNAWTRSTPAPSAD